MHILWSTDVFLTASSQLFRERKENLVLVIDPVLKEGYQLIVHTLKLSARAIIDVR